MPETNPNIWAPWRMEYIQGLNAPKTGPKPSCFLCDYWQNPTLDREHHVLWRTETTLVLLNRFPYSGGHLLLAPSVHQGQLDELPEPHLQDLTRLTRDATVLLREVVKAHGFNVGFNIGRCAGAGLPDHLHAHIVPRWEGDTNFMPVLGDVRVVPVSLDALYEALDQATDRLGLPPLVTRPS